MRLPVPLTILALGIGIGWIGGRVVFPPNVGHSASAEWMLTESDKEEILQRIAEADSELAGLPASAFFLVPHEYGHLDVWLEYSQDVAQGVYVTMYRMRNGDEDYRWEVLGVHHVVY